MGLHSRGLWTVTVRVAFSSATTLHRSHLKCEAPHLRFPLREVSRQSGASGI